MGKRSDFERVARDYYPTPASAVAPLLRHLLPGTVFLEPCAGDARLINHLEAAGHICEMALDIEPQHPDVDRGDAMGDWWKAAKRADCIITNPPWKRKILHPMIHHFRTICPTWLLFDADWIHTKQSSEFMPYCHEIVSIGRVKWIEDSKNTGKDNCAWYLFKKHPAQLTVFHGR